MITQIPFECCKCKSPIVAGESFERWAIGDDRRIHTQCVYELIGECLTLLGALPDDVRTVGEDDDDFTVLFKERPEIGGEQ